MSTVAEWFGGRVEVSRTTLGLFAGDLAAIVLFVVVGEITHGIDPVAAAGYVVTNTLSPFVVGWLLVAVPAGMYGAATRESTPRVALRTAAVWLCADAFAQVVRATPYVQGGASFRASVVFGVVSFVVGGGLLVAWRVGTAVVRSRRRSTALA